MSSTSYYIGYLRDIDIGPDGKPHIIYYQILWGIGEKDLWHLYSIGSAWNKEVAWWFGDGAGCFGVSQTVDSQNVPHLSQYNLWTGYDDPLDPWIRLSDISSACGLQGFSSLGSKTNPVLEIQYPMPWRILVERESFLENDGISENLANWRRILKRVITFFTPEYRQNK